jgi:SAM-dependent methyltransferase
MSRDDAPRAVSVLERSGFRRHPEWSRGAERSFWATSTEIALTRTTSWTTVVRLRWGTPVAPGRLTRAFRPRPADWDVIALPRSLWWAYRVVRPVRLVLDRTGLLRRDHGGLEPFLATPASLIEPLLGLAGVTSDDIVADIGCGDGRIVVGAAQATGCRAVGVEYSPSLVEAARRAVDQAGVGHRVRIVEGDGRSLDVSAVTVVLLFLPMGIAARLVPDLIARLPVGARLVLHEQSPLDPRLPAPAASVPIVTDDAVTVAHLWRIETSDLRDAPTAPTV